MEGIFSLLGWPSAVTVGAFVTGSGIAAVLAASGHIQRAYYRWRLDRRLARNPYILREEMNEHLAQIGEDLPPLDLPSLVGASLLAGAFYAAPIWLAERHLEHWWEIGVIAVVAGAFLYRTWKWLNDPDAPRPILPDAEVPREAVVGFAAAIGIVASLLVFFTWFF